MDQGTAPRIVQSEEGATYDAMLNKPALCRVPLDQPARDLHNFVRGMDSSPGAWLVLEGKEVSSRDFIIINLFEIWTWNLLFVKTLK